jgi:hypothetical protein
VAGDALQLGDDHADRVDVGAGLDAHHLLDGQREAQGVAHGADVVEAVAVGEAPGIVDGLAVLLEAAVEVADVRPRRLHHLAVGLELDAQHAVRRRVLRAHVEDHVVRIEVVVGGGALPVLRARVDGEAGGHGATPARAGWAA